MKFTFEWLKEHLITNSSLEEIVDLLPKIGFEIEEVIYPPTGFIVVEVTEVKPHTNATRLTICSVTDGQEEIQVVCGAPNVVKGMKTVLAKIGAVIPLNNFVIKESKIRGEKSFGMLCSASELNVSSNSGGIIELDNTYIVGNNFFDDDPLIEIAVTPNRGDCLSVRGIARELAGVGIGILKPLDFSFNDDFTSNFKIQIEESEKCSLFAVKEMQNVNNNLGNLPKVMKDRLQKVGIKLISPIVDIVNYVMVEYGQPLHAYDVNKLTGSVLKISNANEESFVGINEQNYILDPTILIVKDEKQPQCIAGVIGSKASECSLQTTGILIEGACFSSHSITTTGQKLNINTEARYRFERNIDPDFVVVAINIAAYLIKKYCGGQTSELLKKEQLVVSKKLIPFAVNEVEEVVGLKIPTSEISRILLGLGFKINEKLEVEVPSYRNDIEDSRDLVEEVIRVYGYDYIPFKSFYFNKENKVSLPSKEHKIRELLVARGFKEVITWSFMDSAHPIISEEEIIKLTHPPSSILNALRPSLIANLLDKAKTFTSKEIENFSIFEIGPIYCSSDKQYNVICAIRGGKFSPKNIFGEDRELDFFDIKADLISLLHHLYITDYTVKSIHINWLHPGQAGAIYLAEEVIAYFGAIHPKYCENNLFALQVFLDKLPNISKKFTYNSFSPYPVVKRDFAFILHNTVNAAAFCETIKMVDQKVIKVELFDMYKGKDLGEENISLAVAVLLQSSDHTLESKEIDELSNKIINSVTIKFGALLRDGKIDINM